VCLLTAVLPLQATFLLLDASLFRLETTSLSPNSSRLTARCFAFPPLVGFLPVLLSCIVDAPIRPSAPHLDPNTNVKFEFNKETVCSHLARVYEEKQV
jgi:hypothetical protein